MLHRPFHTLLVGTEATSPPIPHVQLQSEEINSRFLKIIIRPLLTLDRNNTGVQDEAFIAFLKDN